MKLSSKGKAIALEQMQPVILLGMHRSGTSLVARLLMDIGIYLGNRLEENAESTHFQWLNHFIFAAAGARWSHIEPLVQVMQSPEFVERQALATRRHLLRDNPFLNRYFGLVGFLGSHLPKAVSQDNAFSWGWKDPRNTLTFPIWRRIFPQARFVQIVRNGIDVAISINRRTLRQKGQWLKPDYYSPATLNLDYCFRLWEKYILFALKHKNLIPSEQYLEMRYEALLLEPQEQLRRLVNFLDYPVQESLLSTTCEQVNQSHLQHSGYAVNDRNGIQTLASSPLMQQLGYIPSRITND